MRLGLGLALALLAVRLAIDASVWIALLTFPAEVNFGEGVLLYEAVRLSKGQPIYTPMNQYPFWFGTYPPLYQFLGSLWAQGGLFWLRLVALLAGLWSALAMGLMAWKATRRAAIGALAGLLWATSPFAADWMALARVDMPARALDATALLLAWTGAGSWGSIAGALVFSTLSMMNKQTMFAGGIACTLLLWFTNRRRACVFGAAWVAATLLCYLIFNLASHGNFWPDVIQYTSRPATDWVTLHFALAAFLKTHWGLVLGAVLAVPVCWMEPRGRLFTFAALAGLPHAMLVANAGSDRNYFFPLVWGLCGLAAAAPAFTSPRLPGWWRPACIAAVLAHACVVLVQPVLAPSAQQRAQVAEIQQRLAAIGKPILAEFPTYTLQAGGEPDYLPYMYKVLEDKGQWSSQVIVDKIQRRDYGAILLIRESAAARFGKPILDAAVRNYVEDPKGGYPHTFAANMPAGVTQMLLVPAPR